MEVKVYRDKDNIYINGVRYPIQQAQRGTVSDRVSSLVVPKPDTDGMESAVETLSADLNGLLLSLKDNLFFSAEELDRVQKQGKELMRRVALLRRDIEALIYGD